MTNLKPLRALIRHILKEDVYVGRDFSREKLLANLKDYATGQHAASGVDPVVAKDAVLDDLRVAFGEEGFDEFGSIQRAIEMNNRADVIKAVREIFDTDFLDMLGVRDYLLPGDEDELLTIIVDDLLDGDGRITI